MRGTKHIGVYIISVIAVLFSLIYQCFQPRSIETVTIISGAGLERTDDGKIRLSVQIIHPVKDNSGGSVSSCVILYGDGDTASEAAEDIVRKTGTVLFWAHCQVLLIKEDYAANENIIPELDVFFRSEEFKNSSAIVLTKESPLDVLNSATVYESISAFGIRKLLDDRNYESNRASVTLKDFFEAYYSHSGGIAVPSVELSSLKEYKGGDDNKSADENEEKNVILSDNAVFSDGKFIGYVDSRTYSGVKWLNGTMESKLLTVSDAVIENVKNQSISVYLYDCSAKTKVYSKNGHYVYEVSVKAEAQIESMDGETKSKNVTKQELENRYDELREYISNEITNEVLCAWNKMIELDADFVGVGNRLYADFGKKWLDDETKTAKERLKNVFLNVIPEVKISSGGLNKRYSVN